MILLFWSFQDMSNILIVRPLLRSVLLTGGTDCGASFMVGFFAEAHLVCIIAHYFSMLLAQAGLFMHDTACPTYSYSVWSIGIV